MNLSVRLKICTFFVGIGLLILPGVVRADSYLETIGNGFMQDTKDYIAGPFVYLGGVYGDMASRVKVGAKEASGVVIDEAKKDLVSPVVYLGQTYKGMFLTAMDSYKDILGTSVDVAKETSRQTASAISSVKNAVSSYASLAYNGLSSQLNFSKTKDSPSVDFGVVNKDTKNTNTSVKISNKTNSQNSSKSVSSSQSVYNSYLLSIIGNLESRLSAVEASSRGTTQNITNNYNTYGGGTNFSGTADSIGRVLDEYKANVVNTTVSNAVSGAVTGGGSGVFGPLSASTVTASSSVFSGDVTANAFHGDGSQLTGITSFSTSTTRGVFSSSAPGLLYSTSTGDFSLDGSYNIPLTASTTEWNNKVSSQWVSSGSDVGYTGGNVGVGTNAPASTLHVSAAANDLLTLQSTIGDGGNRANLNFQTYATQGSLHPTAGISAVDDGNYSSSLSFLTKTPGGESNPLVERMSISSNGNVGIGTTPTSNRLSVSGDSNLDGAVTVNGSSNLNGAVSVSGNSNFNGVVNVSTGQVTVATPSGTITPTFLVGQGYNQGNQNYENYPYNLSAYQNSGSGDYTATGIHHEYRVFGYQDTSNGRVYSTNNGSAYFDFYDDGSSAPYSIPVSWTDPGNVNGYRVEKYQDGNFIGGYETTGTSLVDGDGSMTWDNSLSDYPTPQYSFTTNYHAIRIYSYKDVEGQRIYSSSYQEYDLNPIQYQSDNTNYYGIQWQWDPVPGADGYRVFVYNSYRGANFDQYYDTTSTQFNDDDCYSYCTNSGTATGVTSAYSTGATFNTNVGLAGNVSIAGKVTTALDVSQSLRLSGFTLPTTGRGLEFYSDPNTGSYGTGYIRQYDHDQGQYGDLHIDSPSLYLNSSIGGGTLINTGTFYNNGDFHIQSGSFYGTNIYGSFMQAGTIQTNNYFQAPDGSAFNPTYTFSNSPNTGIFSSGSDTLGFSTAGTERLRISPSGNVGIGTANPNYLLSLSNSGGTIGIADQAVYGEPGGALTITGGTGIAGENAGGDLVLRGGNSFTGDPNPAGDVKIYGGINNYPAPLYGGAFRVYTSDTERFTVLKDGNIGIGDTNPSYPLSVSGDGYFTGNVTANAFYGDGSHLTGITTFSTSTTRGVFSASGSGLVYNSSTGDFSLGGGYNIPLTASTTEWAIAYASTTKLTTFWNTPSTRITAGTNLSWSGNTLNGPTDSYMRGLFSSSGSGLSYSSSTGLFANTGVTSLTGTANQVSVSSSTGSITLSLPQSIATTSSPTFAGLTLSNMTSGSVLFAGASGVLSQSNSNLFWDNTNNRLGIGTSTPIATLSIKGVAGTNPFVIASSTGSQLVTVLQNGNVGIGTTTPAEKLVISGGNLKFDLTSGHLAGFINTGNFPSGYGENFITNWQGVTRSILSPNIDNNSNGGVYVPGNMGLYGVTGVRLITNQTGTSTAFNFLTGASTVGTSFSGGTSTLAILGNGFVGIGTSTPSTALVLASGQFTIPSGTSGSPSIIFNNPSGSAGLYSSGVNTIDFVSGGSNAMSLNYSTGLRVGILPGSSGGISNIYAPSQTSGNTNYSAVNLVLSAGASTGSGVGSYISFNTGDTGSSGIQVNPLYERMRISPSGNIGIGTSTPLAKLDIYGTSTSDIFAISSPTNSRLFTIGSNGNVGVGSSTPSALLSINSSSGDSFLIASSTSATQNYFKVNNNAQLSMSLGSTLFDTSGTPFINFQRNPGNTPGSIDSWGLAGTSGIEYKATALSIVSSSAQTTNATLWLGQAGCTKCVRNILEINGNPGIDSGGAPDYAAKFTSASGTVSTTLVVQATSSQTTNLQAWRNSSGTTLSVVDANGSFGLGTTTPWAKLSIQQAFGATTPLFDIASTTSSSFATSSLFTVLSNGNVGIGTSAPTSPLEIATNQSGVLAQQLMLNNTGATSGAGSQLSFKTNSTINGYLASGFSLSGTGQWETRLNGLYYLQFLTNGSARMTLDNVGKLGIGTTTPSAKLDLYGTAGSSDIFAISSSTNARLFTVTAAGSLGIGTASPTHPLTFSATSSSNVSTGASTSGGFGMAFYNTADQTTNYQRGVMYMDTQSGDNGFVIRTENGGTGTQPNMLIAANGLTLDPGSSGRISLTNSSASTLSFLSQMDKTFTINGDVRTAINTASIVFNGFGANVTTSGISDGVKVTTGFQPTSGTSVFNTLDIANTINQTGGASGITRGLYVNPTLTSAADWRSIEIAPNIGYGIYQSGASAKNYFAGNVGIGTTTPDARTTIQGSGTTSSTFALNVKDSAGSTHFSIDDYGDFIFKSNNYSGISMSTGNGNASWSGTHSFQTGINAGAGGINQYGSGTDLQIGNGQWTAVNYNTIIGGSAYNKSLRINNTSNSEIARFDLATGYFGIGTTTPLYRFEVASSSTSGYVTRIINTGNATAANGLVVQAGDNVTGGSKFVDYLRNDGTEIGSISQNGASGVLYNTTSDRRFKENIVDTHYTIDDLMKVQIEDYNFIADPNKKLSTGVIAQDLFNVFPDAVSKPVDETTGQWAVDYGRMTPLIIKGVQDLASTTYAIRDLDSTKIAGQTFIDKLIAWLGDTANGIGTIVAKTIHSDTVETKELCVDNVCITKDQLAHILQTTGTVSVGTSTDSASVPDAMHSGMTIYDQATNQPYCVKMLAGSLVSAAGVCGSESPVNIPVGGSGSNSSTIIVAPSASNTSGGSTVDASTQSASGGSNTSSSPSTSTTSQGGTVDTGSTTTSSPDATAPTATPVSDPAPVTVPDTSSAPSPTTTP